MRLVVVEGMTPALIGIGVGLAAALATGRVLQTMVFGVSPRDPLMLAAIAAGLALVALIATLVPAYRLARGSADRVEGLSAGRDRAAIDADPRM